MKKKQSLRRQFSKNLAWINFMSLFVFVLIIVIHLSIGFKFINTHFSKSVSKQMVQALESDMDIPYSFLGEPYVLIENSDVEKSINLIDYKIYKNNAIVYTSEVQLIPTEETQKQNLWSGFVNWINSAWVSEFKETKTGEFGEIAVSLNSTIIAWVFAIEIFVSLSAFLIIYLITRILAWRFSHALVVPLATLDEKIYQLSSGNIDTVVNQPIIFQNPLEEIENLAMHTNALVALMKQQIDLLEEKNGVIDQKMNELSIIFNRIDQGIFYFDQTLKIQPTYSKMCQEIFDQNIENALFSHLIYETNEGRQFLDELLLKIFEVNGIEREVLISLLPDTSEIGCASVLLSYKMIDRLDHTEILMVILTDVTEKKRLMSQMEIEQNQLKMIVKSLIHAYDLSQLIEDYKTFAHDAQKDEFECHNEALMRELHTFKGSFSLFDFNKTVAELNALEDQLLLAISQNTCIELSEDALVKLLDEDIQIIENYTGRNYLKGHVTEQTGLKSLKEQLSYYTDYVQKLSEKFDKWIQPIEIEGDDIYIEADLYKPFIRSLIHLFRNSVDHGIESLEERVLKNKPDYAQIRCKIETELEVFKIMIEDDGRGIDVSEIKHRAIDLGTMAADKLELLDEPSLLNLIFQQGMTTKSDRTLISGKGIGLSAVKCEVEKLGGHIQVQSQIGEGTTFIIQLPRQVEKQKLEHLKDFIQRISNYATEQIFDKIVREDANYESTDQNRFEFEHKEILYENKIQLLDLTSVISIGAPLNVLVFTSVNRSLLRYLAEKLTGNAIEEQAISDFLEDALAETSNTLVGNALDLYNLSDHLVPMGSPMVLESGDDNIQHMKNEILSVYGAMGEYKLNIHLIPVQEFL